jgi:ribosome-associated protein
MDIKHISSFADYFIICSGTSDRMLDALADAVVDKAREKYKLRGRIEGKPEIGWVLADLGDIIVHLFSQERRDYYRLEELWAEGKVLLHLQ